MVARAAEKKALSGNLRVYANENEFVLVLCVRVCLCAHVCTRLRWLNLQSVPKYSCLFGPQRFNHMAFFFFFLCFFILVSEETQRFGTTTLHPAGHSVRPLNQVSTQNKWQQCTAPPRQENLKTVSVSSSNVHPPAVRKRDIHLSNWCH